MPQLDPVWFSSQLFWLVASFGLLYFLLARVILPPLLEVMARRKQTVEGDLGTAQRAKTAAEEARQAYERTLADARARSQALVNEAMLEHKAKAEKASKELDEQIAKKLAEAEKRIGDAKQKLLDGLTPAAAELASLIVEKLTHRTPANDKVSSIITELSKRGQRS